jgi:hypothetical protein
MRLSLLRAMSVALVAISFAAASARADAPTPVVKGDPWTDVQLVRPAELAKQLADAKAPKPLLLHVGFKRLFGEGAIPGSKFAGTGQRPDGIAMLKKTVKAEPRDRAIVIYCGCCPWDHCPNMRPAFRTLKQMGFKNVRAMYIAKNLDDDWVKAGYPITQPQH